ncbi:MAG: hypothetical protein R3D29_10170 [Nitratireductor sp.]
MPGDIAPQCRNRHPPWWRAVTLQCTDDRKGAGTLPVRMRAHENPRSPCDWLESHPSVTKVLYPDWKATRNMIWPPGRWTIFPA